MFIKVGDGDWNGITPCFIWLAAMAAVVMIIVLFLRRKKEGDDSQRETK